MSIEERPIEPLDAWLNAKPYWERLLWTIASQHAELSDEQIDTCYRHLRIEVEIKEDPTPVSPPICFDNIYESPSDVSVRKPRISIGEIKSIRNVNALAAECDLTCGPHVTLVYGRNGSGKSGLARLLANACFSRGKRDILPNLQATKPSNEKPSASFIIRQDDQEQPVEIAYSLGEHHPALKQVAVFDEQSVHIHLDEPNRVSFVPAYIAIFDRVAAAMARIEKRVADDRSAKRKYNPFNAVFSDPTEHSDVSTFCKGLNASVSDERLLSQVEFTDEHGRKIAELEADIQNKNTSDIAAKLAQLKADEESLDELRRKLETCINGLSSVTSTSINDLVTSLNEHQIIVEQLGVESFDDGILKSLGSAEWKAMLKAAKSLYDKERAARNGNEPAHCVLCHQALLQKQKGLFQSYWQFLESEAETELRRIETQVSSKLQQLRTSKIGFARLTKPDLVLLQVEPARLQELQDNLIALEAVLDCWIEALDQKRSATAAPPSIDLDWIKLLAREKERERGTLQDPTQDIAKLSRELLTLQHRRRASVLKTEALEYLIYLRWEEKIQRVSFAGIKAAMTRKRTEAFLAGFAEDYKTLFNSELSALGCDFNLVLLASGDQGSTVKQYRLEFSEDYTPTQVLSEGEQNACSLADFLTEVQLDVNNCGIVLDDPVSSLDHERKEKIANRLVKEAAHRQVIIFTHDIAFMRKLVDAARASEITFDAHWIDRIGRVPGHIKLNSSPKLASAGSLKSDALSAIKGCEDLDPKEREKAIGIALNYLRSATEALIEEHLFASTIQRYDDQVRVQNLEEAVFDQSIAQRVVDLHGKISEVILAHNRSDAMREDGLVPKHFQDTLDLYSALETDMTKAHKAARAARDTRRKDEKFARKGW